MNKRKIKAMLPGALDAVIGSSKLRRASAADRKSYRSQFSAFGAAVIMGDFKATVAFFGKDGKVSDIDRSELLCIIYEIAYGVRKGADEIRLEILRTNDKAALAAYRESFIHASIAAKQALNALALTEEKAPGKEEAS